MPRGIGIGIGIEIYLNDAQLIAYCNRTVSTSMYCESTHQYTVADQSADDRSDPPNTLCANSPLRPIP